MYNSYNTRRYTFVETALESILKKTNMKVDIQKYGSFVDLNKL